MPPTASVSVPRTTPSRAISTPTPLPWGLAVPLIVSLSSVLWYSIWLGIGLLRH